MPEANGASGTPADPAAQPQAGNPPTPQAGTEPAADAGATTISLEEARSLRNENHGLRTRLRSLEAAEAERAEQGKTELQKAIDRATAAETERDAERTRARDISLRLETVSIARRLGFRDPDLAYRLVGDVEFDAEGKPVGLDKALGELSKAHPYLVNGTPDYGGGPRGTPPAAGVDMNEAIRRAAGR